MLGHTEIIAEVKSAKSFFFLFPPEAGLIEMFHWKPEVIDSS